MEHKPNFVITMQNGSRIAEVWATTYHDAMYVYSSMRFSSKVKRCTLHEIVRGNYCIRAAHENGNWQGTRRARQVEKDLALIS